MYSTDQDIADVVEAFQEPLAGFIRSRVGSDADAEDILQEVWYQFSKTAVQTDLDSVSGWLYRVARNKIIDRYRKKSPDWLEDYLWSEDEDGPYFDDGFLSDTETPEDTYLREQFWEELYEALEAIPEKQREVFVRNELEGLTLREIAEQSGEKLKTIISRKGYAIRQLRIRLEDFFDDFIID